MGGASDTHRLKSSKVMGFASSSTHLTYFACEKVRHIVIFHHLKTEMAWLLLVVPMVALNLKRLEEIEHLIASFREKKIRTINYDHQPVISICGSAVPLAAHCIELGCHVRDDQARYLPPQSRKREIAL